MARPELAREATVSSLDDARRRKRLEELTREHHGFLRGLACKLCRSRFDPDDLVQEVLERALTNFDRLPPDVNHRAWMTRVMQNLFIDWIRRRAAAPAKTPIDDLPLAAPPPETPTWWEQLDAQDVRERLAQLPDELRIAFEMFAFDGRSYQEIAAALGVPSSTVGTRILRARRRLKELFVAAAGGLP
jgi:RNA polymerase sigma-70 factor (ECF subfamily)